MKKQGIDLVVGEDERAVEVWRKRFNEAYERFSDLTLTELAAALGKEDPELFEGLAGFRRMDNVRRGIAGEKITRKAVLLMEQLRPAKPVRSSRLGRQNLSKA